MSAENWQSVGVCWSYGWMRKMNFFWDTDILLIKIYSLIACWYLNKSPRDWKFVDQQRSSCIQTVTSPSRVWTAPTSILPSTAKSTSSTESMPPTHTFTRPPNKHCVDRQTSCEVMTILVYIRCPPVAILHFRKLKILPLDRLSPTTPRQS